MEIIERKMKKECNHNFKVKETFISIRDYLFRLTRFEKVYVLECKRCGVLKIGYADLGQDFFRAEIKEDLKWKRKR